MGKSPFDVSKCAKLTVSFMKTKFTAAISAIGIIGIRITAVSSVSDIVGSHSVIALSSLH